MINLFDVENDEIKDYQLEEEFVKQTLAKVD